MKSTVQFSPTVVIGLGGTGHGVLLKLKKRFQDEFKEVPPIVEFLSIDTTQEANRFEEAADGKRVELEPNKERYMVQVEDPSTLLNPNNPHILRWWTSGSTVSSIVSGAQQIRQRGRLALFANYSDIRDRLAQKIDEVRKVENISAMKDKGFYVSERKGVDVFVVSSLAGGTGSGMFLDIAFILRSINPSSNVSGVFILPRVFARLPGTDLIKANTYAALKEIESYSKIRDTETRVINYGVDTIRIKRPPFDMTYIVDSVNERERVIDDVKILNSRVAEGLYILIGSEIGTGNTNAIDNIKSHLASAGLVNTHSASYCSFGVASCRWKAEEFMKGYERRQLESARVVVNAMMDTAADAAAAKGDAAKFVQERRLSKGQADNLVGDFGKLEGLPKSFHLPISGRASSPEDINRIRDERKPHIQAVTQRINELLAGGKEKLAESLKRDFDDWLNARESAASYLPYGEEFAKEIGAHLRELIDALDRKLAVVERELNDIAKEFEQLDVRVEAAKKKPHIWTGQGAVKKNIETACGNYSGAVDKQARKILAHAQIRYARDLAQALSSHAGSAGQHYAATRERMRAILDSLVDPGKEDVGKKENENPFDHTIKFVPEPPEFKTTSAEFITWCREKHGSLYAFTKKPDDEVKAGILEFVRADNMKLTDLSIEYVLKEALKLRDAKKEELYLSVKESLDQLSHLSAPLWRYNESEIPLTRKNINTKLSYCGVPDAENPVAEEYKGSWLAGTNTRFIGTIDRHRLIFFNITFGVPLFALQGIREMEHEYFAKRDNVPCDLSDRWKNYPNLIPKQAGSVMETFALAQVPDFGFIRRGKDNYYTVHLSVNGTPKEIKLAKGRKEAFEVFKDKLHIVQDVSDAIGEKLEGEDLNKLRELLHAYRDKLQAYGAAKGNGYHNGGNGSNGTNGSHAHGEDAPAPEAEDAPPESEEDLEFIKYEIAAITNFDKGIRSL